MKLRCFFVACGLLFFAAGAGAQVGLYLNPIVTRVSISTPDSGPFALLGQGNTSGIFGGVSLGGYYTLSHNPKLGFAIDVRDELQHGNSALLNGFLFGARVSGTHSALKPYLQLSGGLGSTHSPLSPARINKPIYKIYGGLDYTLNKHVDLRAIEVGYGGVTTVSSAQFGGTTPISSASLLSVSAGLVFKIP